MVAAPVPQAQIGVQSVAVAPVQPTSVYAPPPTQPKYMPARSVFGPEPIVGRRRNPAAIVFGAIFIAGGIGLVAGGASLIAHSQCPGYTYDGTCAFDNAGNTGGIAMVTTGLIAGIGGIVLFSVGLHGRRVVRTAMAVSEPLRRPVLSLLPTASGAPLGMTVRVVGF